MRRTLAVLVSVVAILGLLGPPAFAQAPAPAPKVTINGLLDFVTTAYRNSTGEAGTGQRRDVTNSDDRGWYSRERGVFTITGEIGRSKGVLALEFDFNNGHTTNNFQDAGFGGNSGLDAETDEKGQVEVKWLYLETPITGQGSLMPFIPVTSIGRFGGQPARGIDYKPGILFTGDFPGVTLETTWAPNLRSTLFYSQIEERLDPINNPRQGSTGTGGRKVEENYGLGAAVELDVFKGLTVKPVYVYTHCRGGCQGNTGDRFTNPVNTSNGTGVFARGGFDPGSGTDPTIAGAQATLLHERHTIGGDVRWTSGPWSLQPTFLYQFGKQEVRAANNDKADDSIDIRAYIFDVIGGFRTGPLNLEGRVLYTPGMKIKDCVDRIAGVCGGGSTIHYYEPLMQGTASYWAGWSEIEGSGVDYNVALRQTSGTQLGRSPSYDKYGRIALGAAGDYSLTPALTFHAVSIFQWTAEKVDRTASDVATSNGGGGRSLRPNSSDKTSRFLGHEWDLGLTYRFAPNVAFDLIGAVLFVGEARDNGRTVSTPAAPQSFTAQDAYKLSARVRVTW